MSCLCTISGLVLILGFSDDLVYYLVEGHIPSGLIEVFLFGVVMFLFGLVLLRYNIKRNWGHP